MARQTSRTEAITVNSPDDLPEQIGDFEMEASSPDGTGCAKLSEFYTWRNDGRQLEIARKHGSLRVRMLEERSAGIWSPVEDLGRFHTLQGSAVAAIDFIEGDD